MVRDQLEAWGEPRRADWLEKPAKGDPNPYDAVDPSRPWPEPGPGREAALRLEAAARGARRPTRPRRDDDLDMVEAARVADWDVELDRLVAEARADRDQVVDVPLPTSLSATALGRLRTDPEAFARELARPMPRQPSPAARFGTRFHAWVEARFGQQDLFDPDELPGQADAGIDSDDDLAELIATFERGPFADRAPHAVEAPFALVLDGQVVRGRIDAVYAEPATARYLVVDWKTARRDDADALQLALYRLAWAELAGVPLERVRRGVLLRAQSGASVEPDDLRPERRRRRLTRRMLTPAVVSAAREAAARAISTMSANVCSRSWSRGLLAGDDVVGDGADRQRPAAVLGGQGVERARLHLHGQHAVARPSAGVSSGRLGVERVAGEEQPDVDVGVRGAPRPRPRRAAARSRRRARSRGPRR